MTTGLCLLSHYRDPDRPRQALAGANVCAAHYRKLEQMIAESPALDNELVRVHTASRGAQGERVSASKTPGLNIREDAIEARAELHTVLVRWADHTAAARGFTRPAADAPLGTISTFLLRNLQWIVRQNDSGWLEAQHDRLGDAHHHGKRVLQPSERPHLVDVGPCIEQRLCHVGDGSPEPEQCPGTLQVTFLPGDANPDDPPPVISCPVCGVRYEASGWYSLGKRLGKRGIVGAR